MPVRVLEEWFAGCGGCEVAILDMGEVLLDVLPELEFVYIPVLADSKFFGQDGNGKEMDYPHADVALISGSVRTKENWEAAKQIRARSKVLIALGSCAAFGGISALANLSTNREIYDAYYGASNNNDQAEIPELTTEEMLNKVYALNEVVEVDLILPGCSPTPASIAKAITALLKGEEFKLSEKSVCDTCPLERKSKWGLETKRPLASAQFTPGDYNKTRCLAEQGILCLGPVTRAGCAERLDGEAEVPGCIRAFMPCRGCWGPVHTYTTPMSNMLGALASIGADTSSIPDKKALFNRYIGAHGNLNNCGKG
ncbi:MAG: methyl viologen-reducing hydrogenase [Chloroflexi bacterium]|nr:methyl viologen-reducing hydrogenase [Chloroflexota bacterium]